MAADCLGRRVPRLVVLAVDGAEQDREVILARLGLRVPVVGLVDRQSVRTVFGFRGVPGLVWVSDSGAVMRELLEKLTLRKR